MLFVLVILLFVGGFLTVSRNQKLLLELSDDDNISVLLTANNKQQRIYPWYNELDDKYYFFLPAFCRSNVFYFNNQAEEDKVIFLNGVDGQSGSKFPLQEKEPYQLEIRAEDANVEYNIIFLQSENLPAVFVDTDSGNMEYIHENKENEEEGSIDIVTVDGNVEYSGRLSKISGRGNSTWEQVKKPYAIKLQEEMPLLGMANGDKWCLLAGLREGAKMNDKVAFDIAELVGLDCSPQCTWIDLYLNGEYAGIYLLTESVSVGQGRVNIHDLETENREINSNIKDADTFDEGNVKGYIIDNSNNISGGYLFEKDFTDYWENEPAGFMDSNNNTFSIKSPQHASKEQVEYLFRYVQSISDMLNDGNIEYRNYIDIESFAQKFIVDEIALSFDVNVTSMFYYKNINDDLLYAGPVWDFDLAFGEGNGDWVDYEHSILNPSRDSHIILDWYTKLYGDEVFRTKVIEIYSDTLPRMEELIETKIDIYADYIRKSVELDKIRWDHLNNDESVPGHYTEFDNNVRYLQFFLAKRLNYLNERWNIDYNDLMLPTQEGTHEITFWLDGELIETRTVADGELLQELPYLDENAFWGWYFTYNDEKYWVHLPIYEDTAFYARRKTDG